MKSFAALALFALAGSAAANKKVKVAVTGYYNGIDTIGGSGSTAHFQGVQVNCVDNKKKLCEDKSGKGISCAGDEEVFLGCNGLPIWYKSTLNCGKEKITACHARSTPGFGNTIEDNDTSGGYSNIGIGSSEVSRCVSVIEFDIDDAGTDPCA